MRKTEIIMIITFFFSVKSHRAGITAEFQKKWSQTDNILQSDKRTARECKLANRNMDSFYPGCFYQPAG